MTDSLFSDSERPLEDEVARVLSNLLNKNEGRVDGFLRRLHIDENADSRTLRRLDRAFLLAAAATGVAKGVGTTARKNLKIPGKAIDRASSAALLSLTAIYILAHARVRGVPAGDERVRSAVRDALMASAALPVGQMMIEQLARFARPAVGLPTDPRTWFVMAAGAAGGGIAGNAIGKGIVDSVYSALDDSDIDIDFTVIDGDEGQ